MMMKTILGNFLDQPNKDFPLDAETLDAMQQNQALLAVLGNIAGDKAVLLGCEPEQNNTGRRPGYVFIRTKDFPEGEILYWEGGAVSAGMYVKQEPVAVTAQGYEYPQAYTMRSLAPGVGGENYRWVDFSEGATIPELKAEIARQQTEIAALTPPPLGIVQMWAGANVPENYELCDGRELKIEDYRELHKAIGERFNKSYDCNGKQYATTAGYFRLPDLRGRFIVGYNSSDADYGDYGRVGGEKMHTLTVDELPAHTHSYQKSILSPTRTGNTRNEKFAQYEATNTSSVGGGRTHENRPPYYALAYIMKVR